MTEKGALQVMDCPTCDKLFEDILDLLCKSPFSIRMTKEPKK